MQLHYRFLQHLHLIVNISFLYLHACRLSFSRVQRRLEHDVLLVQALLLVFNVFSALLQEFLLGLAFLQLFMELFRGFLLFARFVSHSCDFTFDL
jgi:hypothetical protein